MICWSGSFEEDANRVLPSEVVYEHWRDDVMMFFKYLADNSVFALNIYNSNSRIYMSLGYFKRRLQGCIRKFYDNRFRGEEYRPYGF